MYLGIDTHTRYSQVAVVDDEGNLQDEIRLLNDCLDEIAVQYTGSQPAIEASGHHRPVDEKQIEVDGEKNGCTPLSTPTQNY